MKALKPSLFSLFFLLSGSGVYASDYGCKVLLCLANPNGPKAVAECVPPINQLYRDLARGRSFPTCELANAPAGGRSWAQRGASYYDACPAGTNALPAGSYAVQGGADTGSAYYAGIGEGDGLSPASGDGTSPLPAKVCVGEPLATTSITTGSGDGQSSLPAGIYSRVIRLEPQGSPNVIDVFVDSVFYRRVRW